MMPAARTPLRRAWLIALTVAASSAAWGEESWTSIQEEARGQTVYFNAWGGDAAINRYVSWAGAELKRAHGVNLVLVKVTDIAETVTRIQAEKSAGRSRGGSVDLMWINGENFASLKRAGLLFGPWLDDLPNARLLNAADQTQRLDFALSTDGLEAPWGGARFTFFYDAEALAGTPPHNPRELLTWIRAHPGRFTYPQPPNFVGSAFLKQLLILLCDRPERLQKPVADDFGDVTRPLWAWLDSAHPKLWRSGEVFPRSAPEQRRLLGDGEVDWMLAFNPAEAARAIRAGELQRTVAGLHLEGGTLANSHFLAIPFNSSAHAGARIVANFLLSPEAQARKADVEFWGDPTVLSLNLLNDAQRAPFSHATRDASIPPPPDRLIPEPHATWTPALERAWAARYGAR